MKTKRLISILLGVGGMLLIPFIAMQFTSEVNWSVADFIVMGSLLLTAALACSFILSKVKRTMPRLALCLVVLAMLLLVWAELAVGVFGSPFSGS